MISQEASVCTVCFGSRMEIVPGKGARQCPACRIIKEVDPLKKTGIPKRYENCHFQNYRPRSSSQKKAFDAAFRLALEYPRNDIGLLLMGTCGVGKTHLAISVIKALAERNFACRFIEVGHLFKKLRETYSRGMVAGDNQLVNDLNRAEVLVLDEIGGSKPTEWSRDILAEIINYRYNNRKTTILTTNFFDTRSSPDEETLTDRIGIPLRSRIYEMCRGISIKGADVRMKRSQFRGFC